MNVRIDGSFLEGTVKLPASKSYLHRALIAAALSDSESVISNFTLSNDILDTIKVIESMGCVVEVSKVIKVIPSKLNNKTFRIMESGTTYRLMIPILSALFTDFEIEVNRTLRKRPINEFEKHGLNREKKKHSWLISPGVFCVDGSVSSQYVSGLLFALPILNGDSKIIVTNMSSDNYILMTVEVLKAFGINIEIEDNTFLIKGNQSYKGSNYNVEPDFSALAFWAVAGTVNGSIHIEAPEESLQPDFEIIALLKAVADLEYNDGYHFKKSHIVPFRIDVNNCPDLAPALSVLAMYADGPCEIKGIDRLIYKESDRIKGILKLRKFGALIEKENTLKFKQGSYHSGAIRQNDHRIAMMVGILPEESVVKNVESIDKSYPSFLKDLEMLGKKVEEL